MANNLMLNVNPETFNLDVFVNALASNFRGRGYTVTAINMNGSYMLTFEKGIGGINTVLGLGESIKATCMFVNGMLTVNFSDEEWTSKIIGIVVGWFLCLIPFITGIIGVTRQLQLPKTITSDATMIASTM